MASYLSNVASYIWGVVRTTVVSSSCTAADARVAGEARAALANVLNSDQIASNTTDHSAGTLPLLSLVARLASGSHNSVLRPSEGYSKDPDLVEMDNRISEMETILKLVPDPAIAADCQNLKDRLLKCVSFWMLGPKKASSEIDGKSFVERMANIFNHKLASENAIKLRVNKGSLSILLMKYANEVTKANFLCIAGHGLTRLPRERFGAG